MLGLALLFVIATGGCRSTRDGRIWKPGSEQKGIASWYGPGFHGKQTANGEVFDTHALTAAHKTLPFDSIVEVTNLDNGKRVRVRINDRGPFIRGRIIDLSKAGAQAIKMIGPGTARVSLRVIKQPAKPTGGKSLSVKMSYIVQVGAFRDAGRARKLSDRLRPSHPDVRVTSSGDWHRVQIGPFKDQLQAQEVAGKLNREGFEAVVKAVG
jgi:rare lipoprotein A